MPVFTPKESKQKGDIKAVLNRQLAPDRHEFKTAYVNSFEMIENSKRAEKNVGNRKQQHREFQEERKHQGKQCREQNIIKNKIPNVEDMKLQVELLRKELQTEV